MRIHGVLASCITIGVGGVGILLSAHWQYQVAHPGVPWPIEDLSTTFFPYLVLGIGETLGMALAIHYFRQSHVAWVIGTLILAVAGAGWIAGSILLVTGTMPFAYPTPIMMLGAWIGAMLASLVRRAKQTAK